VTAQPHGGDALAEHFSAASYAFEVAGNVRSRKRAQRRWKKRSESHGFMLGGTLAPRDIGKVAGGDHVRYLTKPGVEGLAGARTIPPWEISGGCMRGSVTFRRQAPAIDRLLHR
jgi:hypothetical protein